MKHPCLTLALMACTALAQAGVVTTSNLAEVAAFQQGLNVQTFEDVGGRTPMSIDAFPAKPLPVSPAARVYDQVPGFRFSSGFKPGEVMAGLFRLETDGGDGGAGNTLLAGLSPDNETQFDRNELIEAYLPAKVAQLGFWLTPELGRARVYFLSSNFAFNPDETEELWDSVVVEAGQFVGLSRSSADIGGLKIIALTDRGFAIDDLSFGGSGSTQPVAEPASAWLALAALLAAASAGTSARRRS